MRKHNGCSPTSLPDLHIFSGHTNFIGQTNNYNNCVMPDIPTDSKCVVHYKYLDSNSAVLHDQHILFVAIPSFLVMESDLELV